MCVVCVCVAVESLVLTSLPSLPTAPQINVVSCHVVFLGVSRVFPCGVNGLGCVRGVRGQSVNEALR